MFLHRSIPLLLCLSLLSTNLWAYPLTIEHRQGSVTLSSQPQRVVVYDLGLLDTLTALNVKIAGLPQTQDYWPEYLQQYANPSYAKVGSLFEPDYTALEALKPDLILIAGRSSAAYEKLSALAPTLDLSLDPADFVEGVRHNLQQLGQIFNREDKAEALETELLQTLEALQTRAGTSTGLVLFTINDNIMIHAPGERFGMINALTGMASVATPAEASASTSQRPAPGSPEARALAEQRNQRLAQAMGRQPDWLFVLDRGAATGGEQTAAATLANNAVITASSAWQKQQVYYLDPTGWYIATGGYLGLLHTAQELLQRITP